MNNQDIPTNQTVFSGELPIYQNPESIATQAPEEDQDQKPWYKTKKILFAVVPGVLLLLVVLVALLPRKTMVTEETEVTPTPVIDTATDPMLERIQRLQAELKEADPTKTDILFPPVDMELELDPAED